MVTKNQCFGTLKSMGSRFIRKVRTASGAVAVQIVEKNGRTVTGMNISAPRTPPKTSRASWQQRRDGCFPARTPSTSVWNKCLLPWTISRTGPRQNSLQKHVPSDDHAAPPVDADAKAIAAPATVLWETLEAAYDRLGFSTFDDPAFKAMVLARLIEPTSKAQTIHVLKEIDAPHPSLRTLFRSLGTCIDKDYRDQLAKAMVAYRSATAGLASLVMYDVTT